MSFSQVPINDNVPLSNWSSLCSAQDGFWVEAETGHPGTGPSRSPVDTPDLWLLGQGRGVTHEAAEARRGALPPSSSRAILRLHQRKGPRITEVKATPPRPHCQRVQGWDTPLGLSHSKAFCFVGSFVFVASTHRKRICFFF